ncbi:hypothetical protein NEOLEDRAFT_519657 [Neolentinus lepideus HHB14362 ss-1]|uniref:Uncharacterized protein n=1 Tax=Neolentinus lepideus HHB14362 ss-1 TaxID=1314782 RepID=A0A165RI37_9AGAM|nr:hypothetical protein NEOLEDRAFT_519657 [Neolentinus lepideus HHB14362 ss-1]
MKRAQGSYVGHLFTMRHPRILHLTLTRICSPGPMAVVDSMPRHLCSSNRTWMRPMDGLCQCFRARQVTSCMPAVLSFRHLHFGCLITVAVAVSSLLLCVELFAKPRMLPCSNLWSVMITITSIFRQFRDKQAFCVQLPW